MLHAPNEAIGVEHPSFLTVGVDGRAQILETGGHAIYGDARGIRVGHHETEGGAAREGLSHAYPGTHPIAPRGRCALADDL